MTVDPARGVNQLSESSLCPCIRSLYGALIHNAAQSGIKVRLIQAIRDMEQQKRNVANGASRTLKSKHLPQPPNGLALAFDIAPAEYLDLKAWNPNGPQWKALGEIGEALGLTWGGRWRTFVDKPHFQLEECECPR